MYYISIAVGFLLIICVLSCDESSNNSSQPPQTVDEIIEQGFMEADLDGDGVINLEEVEIQVQNDFDRKDQDSDGEITEKDHIGPEYLGDPVKKEERNELKCDANDDEIVTLAEYKVCINETVIDIMDADQDGLITLVDFAVP